MAEYKVFVLIRNPLTAQLKKQHNTKHIFKRKETDSYSF